jgi:glycosyltransferase involved in cell wall biosynthesis
MPSVASEDFGFQETKTNSKFSVISAGRMVPLKGFDLSILSFAQFINSLTEQEKLKCELILVGSGPETNYLKKLADQNQISKYITFIDWIERKKLIALYGESSVFLFPSHEGAGMVVSEALSFGLPVICLENSGPGEFIDENSGFAVQIQSYSKTINALSKAITQLHSNKTLAAQMRNSARLRYLNHFNWDKRGEELHNIYSKF